MRIPRWIATIGLALALGTPALAGPPAAIPPDDAAHAGAHRSFQDFAARWMRTLEQDATRVAGQIPPRGDPARRGATYRSVGRDFQIELRPTGSPRAPYVGILRYLESTHRCADSAAAACGVATRSAITEIFRFQNGQWVY